MTRGSLAVEQRTRESLGFNPVCCRFEAQAFLFSPRHLSCTCLQSSKVNSLQISTKYTYVSLTLLPSIYSALFLSTSRLASTSLYGYILCSTLIYLSLLVGTSFYSHLPRSNLIYSVFDSDLLHFTCLYFILLFLPVSIYHNH